MAIESISWQRVSEGTGDSVATFPGFELYVGLCDQDYLGTEFDDNFIPGSKTLVFSADPLAVSGEPGDWFTIDLDSPYWYNGQDNLLIELSWNGGTGSFHTYMWNSPGVPRSLKAPTPDGPTGFLSSTMSELMLDGVEGLPEATFGHIKVVLGN